MKQVNSAILLVFLLTLAVIGSGLALLKGGLFLGKHEVDTFHVIDILLRMADGDRIHVDFHSPIGVLAFAPIIWLGELGLNYGAAFLITQALLAFLLVLPLWWIGVSRLGNGTAMFLGGVTLILVTAIVDGQTDVAASISMYYNRWGWALAFVVMGLALLPRRRKLRDAGYLEGCVIGLCMLALAFLKITFAAALVFPISLALLVNGNRKGFVAMVVTGCFVAGLLTVTKGVEFWQVYLFDLQVVAASPNRAYPSANLADMIAAPAFLPVLIVAFAALLFLRQAAQGKEALLLLVILPALYFITYQNFGNDPVWLVFFVVYIFASRPEGEFRNDFGWDLRSSLTVVAVSALVIIAPALINFTTSGLRHLGVDKAQYQRAVSTERFPKTQDIHMADIRSEAVQVRIGLASPITQESNGASSLNPVGFEDVAFPNCQITLGNAAYFAEVAEDLSAFAGEALFVADVTTAYWVFSEMMPAKGTAPWGYGGLPGLENADILSVPFCASQLSVRNEMLNELSSRNDIALTLLKESGVSAVYRINRLSAESSDN